MTPVIASKTTSITGGTASGAYSLAKPSGLVAGDLILVLGVCSQDNTNPWPEITSPDAYTRITHADATGADVQIAIYWRICTGGETWPLTGDNGTHYLSAWCMRITGAHPTDPIHQVGTFVDLAASFGTTLTIGEVTTTKPGCLGLAVVGADGSSTSPFTVTSGGPAWAIVEHLDDEHATNDDVDLAAAYLTKELSSPGGSTAIGLSFSDSDGKLGVQIAIAPAFQAAFATGSNQVVMS